MHGRGKRARIELEHPTSRSRLAERITNDHWRGDRDEPINPSTVRFKAKEAAAPSCEGCLFERSVGVCLTAAALAVANDQPDCDGHSPAGMTYIYVLDKSDPRQLDLIKPLKHLENTL